MANKPDDNLTPAVSARAELEPTAKDRGAAIADELRKIVDTGTSLTPNTNVSTESETQRRAEVLSLLDSEIEAVRAVLQKQGWTDWVLVAAAAALVWTGLGLAIEQKVGRAQLFVLGALAIRMGLQAGDSAATALGFRMQPRTERLRLSPSPDEGAGTRFFLLQSMVALVALFWCRSFVSTWLFVVVMFHEAAMTVVLVVLLSRKPNASFAFQLDQISRWASRINAAWCTLLTVALLWMVRMAGAGLLEIRSALAIGAVLWIAERLLANARAPQPVAELASVRREFVLSHLNADDACRRIDRILYGTRLDDVLALNRQRVQEALAKLAAIQDALEKRLTTTLTALRDGRPFAEIDAIFKERDPNELDNWRTAHVAFSETYSKVRAHARFLKFAAPSETALKQIEQFLTELYSKIDALNQQVRRIGDADRETAELLDALFRDGDDQKPREGDSCPEKQRAP